MRKSSYLVLSVLMVLTMLLAACGAEPTQPPAKPAEATTAVQPTAVPEPTVAGPEKGGTLTIGVDQEPPTMDPHASPSAITFFMISSAGEGLLYIDADRNITPCLAESYDVNADGTEYTFKLRSDVVFQDGTPMDAEAVKWNFDRIVDPNYTAGAALGYVEGYDSTEIVDASTVKIKFKEPFVPFLNYVASPVLALLSPTATKAQGDQVNQLPVMTGPYKISEYVAKDHVTLTRWDGYTRTPCWADHEGPGYVDTMIWKFIPETSTRIATVESGETQVVYQVPYSDLPRLEGSTDFTIVKRAWVGAPLQWLLNVTLPPTDDIKVRQAINYGLDRNELVNTLYKGTGVLPIAALTASLLDDPALQGLYTFDLDKAKQLLDEAGWSTIGSDGVRTNASGTRLAIQINSIDYGTGPREIDQWVQGQLIRLGIDTTLKAQARPPWYEDNYNCATNGPIMIWRSGDYDGLFPLWHSSRVGGNFNWACIKSPELDKLMEEGRGITDLEKRKQHYAQIEKMITDQALTAPLVDELAVWALRTEVTGIKFNGFSYPVLADAYFVKK